jgi:hypothetical protein
MRELHEDSSSEVSSAGQLEVTTAGSNKQTAGVKNRAN